MSRVQKAYDIASFKALPEEDGKGRFEAIVSVFGNVDYQGDRVMPGAFGKTIESWRKSGDPVPIIWSHDWGNPMAHIGWADPSDLEEIQPGKADGAPGGLLVRGSFDVDKPFAKQVYDLLRSRRVKEWSFAYDVIDEAKGKDGANELRQVSLIEAGPTLKGANPDTVTLGVKSQLDRAAKEQSTANVIAAVNALGAEVDAKNFEEIYAAAMDADPAIADVLARPAYTPEPEPEIAAEEEVQPDPLKAAIETAVKALAAVLEAMPETKVEEPETEAKSDPEPEPEVVAEPEDPGTKDLEEINAKLSQLLDL